MQYAIDFRHLIHFLIDKSSLIHFLIVNSMVREFVHLNLYLHRFRLNVLFLFLVYFQFALNLLLNIHLMLLCTFRIILNLLKYTYFMSLRFAVISSVSFKDSDLIFAPLGASLK